MIALGNNIKIARKRMGLTQEELALQIGITAQAVSRWESGAGMPDISMIVPLAQVLSVTTDTLFGMEQTNTEDSDYITIKTQLDELANKYNNPAERAYQRCQYVKELLLRNPASHITSCFYTEEVANLSRYVDFENYAKEVWPEFRETAIRYGLQVIRFSNNKEFIERTHFALAWIYIHEGDYASAREHIDTLPSISNNRLQESILAQLASFEHGIDGMKKVLRNNLQNFTRALNKEVLYAMEDFSWHEEPLAARNFGLWGIDLIHILSRNPDLISFCRGFTRDIYKYILHADLRAEDYEAAAKHFQELQEEMQLHFNHYQNVLKNEDEMAKYSSRNLRNMRIYTSEFIKEKQEDILNRLREWHGEEKYQKFLEKLNCE